MGLIGVSADAGEFRERLLLSRHEEVSAIVQASGAATALRLLYETRRKKSRKFSLTYYCVKAGIPSKGYLAAVMTGKRILSSRYTEPLIKAFQLSEKSADCLRTMILASRAKSVEESQKLNAKVELQKKSLQFDFRPMAMRLRDVFFAMEVFSSFGLFGNRPSLQMLVTYFGDQRTKDIDSALLLLQDMQVIDRDDLGNFFPLKDLFVLGEDHRDLSHLDLLKEALRNASMNIETWFPDKKRSFFVSSILSTKMERYESALEAFKKQFLLAEADLESGDADMLVRLNVQIYPVMQGDP